MKQSDGSKCDVSVKPDRCSVCGVPFEDTGKKQQCRNCGMFANLCCDPQMPIDLLDENGRGS